MLSSPKLPLRQALSWIFLSTLVGLIIVLIGWLYMQHLKELRLKDNRYRIIALVQTTPQRESLKTVYLAELLDLSLDKPTNLYQFNVEEGEKKLLASPLIKKASIKKIRPGVLYVDYTMRTPVAYLGDYTNMAIDEDGYLFPVSPFFTPKKMPVLYLGLEQSEFLWGLSVRGDERLQLAFDICEQFNLLNQDQQVMLKQVDVSKAFSDSYGQRQIVLSVEEKSKPILIRLSLDQYQKDLKRYFRLRQTDHPLFKPGLNKIKQKPAIIDLRVPQLAFIKEKD